MLACKLCFLPLLFGSRFMIENSFDPVYPRVNVYFWVSAVWDRLDRSLLFRGFSGL